MKTRHAFTLIELLISASLTTIVILGVYAAFQTGAISYNKIDTSFNAYQTAIIGLARVESDLKNSYAYLEKDSGFSGTATQMSFFSVVDEFDTQGKSARQIAGLNMICKGRYLKEPAPKA